MKTFNKYYLIISCHMQNVISFCFLLHSLFLVRKWPFRLKRRKNLRHSSRHDSFIHILCYAKRKILFLQKFFRTQQHSLDITLLLLSAKCVAYIVFLEGRSKVNDDKWHDTHCTYKTSKNENIQIKMMNCRKNVNK